MVAVVDDEDFESTNKHRWCAMKNKHGFYAVRRIVTGAGKRLSYMHKVIMGAARGQVVDHKDRNTLDNRKGNLRFATKGQDNANRGKRADNTTGFKGAKYNRRRGTWSAAVKGKHIGVFPDGLSAAKAYDEAAVKCFGEFAVTNQSLGLL